MIDAHFNRLFPLRDPTFVCDDRVCEGVMANLAALPRSLETTIQDAAVMKRRPR